MPSVAANSRTVSPLFDCAAISFRHFVSAVVIRRIVAIAGAGPRWGYRALTLRKPHAAALIFWMRALTDSATALVARSAMPAFSLKTP